MISRMILAYHKEFLVYMQPGLLDRVLHTHTHTPPIQFIIIDNVTIDKPCCPDGSISFCQKLISLSFFHVTQRRLSH